MSNVISVTTTEFVYDNDGRLLKEVVTVERFQGMPQPAVSRTATVETDSSYLMTTGVLPNAKTQPIPNKAF